MFGLATFLSCMKPCYICNNKTVNQLYDRSSAPQVDDIEPVQLNGYNVIAKCTTCSTMDASRPKASPHSSSRVMTALPSFTTMRWAFFRSSRDCAAFMIWRGIVLSALLDVIVPSILAGIPNILVVFPSMLPVVPSMLVVVPAEDTSIGHLYSSDKLSRKRPASNIGKRAFSFPGPTNEWLGTNFTEHQFTNYRARHSRRNIFDNIMNAYSGE